jgi:uncharacterized repeat protein (TIGR02543 family)
MVPSSPNLSETQTQTIPIILSNGIGSATVTFPVMKFGTYTLTAEARDETGTILYTQTATYFHRGKTPVPFYLVPASYTDANKLDAQTLSVSVSPGLPQSWRIPSGADLFAGDKIAINSIDPDDTYYIQSLSGQVFSQGKANTTISTANFPSNSGYYITLLTNSQLHLFSFSGFYSSPQGIEMVKVPKGSFQRDATSTNESRQSTFLMGRNEVTEAQWRQVTGDMSAYAYGANFPKTDITWFDAVGFCNRLSEMEGLQPGYIILIYDEVNGWLPWDGTTFPVNPGVAYPTTVIRDMSKNGYRLPSEMEWMWAAMGSTNGHGYTADPFTAGYTKAFAGDDFNPVAGQIDLYAWNYQSYVSSVQPVRGKLPNELGIFDMSGNAAEWCADTILIDSIYPDGLLINYVYDDNNLEHPIRGGTFYDSLLDLDSRIVTDGAIRSDTVGFRVARNSVPLYTLSYDSNGGDAWVSEDNNLYDASMSVITLTPEYAEKTGYTYEGWNTRADGSGQDVAGGDTISFENGSVTLYAKWIPVEGNFYIGFGNNTFETSHPAWYVMFDPSEQTPPYLHSGAIGPGEASVIEYSDTDTYNGGLAKISFTMGLSSKSGVGFLKLEVFADRVPVTLPGQSTWTGNVPLNAIEYNWESGSEIQYESELKVRWTYYKNHNNNTNPGNDAAEIKEIDINILRT